MKFLLDVGISPRLGALLEQSGHTFRFVPDHYSNRLSDAEILEAARVNTLSYLCEAMKRTEPLTAEQMEAIIMQDDGYASSLPTTVVIPLSSAMAALRFPGTAQVKATDSSGLRTDSVALVFQMCWVMNSFGVNFRSKAHLA